jgi:hypothetical protein
MTMLPEPITVTLRVANVLQSLGIPYFIGGSMATAVHGMARATLDADIIADMKPHQVERFTQALGGDFFADSEAIGEAVRVQGTFNVIHLATMFKVDIFVRGAQPFDQAQFRRRMLAELGSEPGHQAYVASPEDNILAKLVWYRLGGEVSDRQWRDIVTVIRIHGARLDAAYLRIWSERLNVTDLLETALRET